MSKGRMLFYAFAVAVVATVLFAQSTFQPRPIDPACAFVGKALDSARQLRPGMKRIDVEKKFEVGSFVSRQNTVYVYRSCWMIHIDVVFNVPPGNGANLSPDDEIQSVSKPYLDYPTYD
jgi:hypothetical protein